mgnify:FL=1
MNKHIKEAHELAIKRHDGHMLDLISQMNQTQPTNQQLIIVKHYTQTKQL